MSNTQQEGQYVPYGPEWESELMKHSKKSLIDLYRRQLTSPLSVDELKQKFAQHLGVPDLDTSDAYAVEWAFKNI